MSKLLDELNPSQREAVTHESGPLLIIAGPGSGKTRTVVHSIAYAIENGVLPDRILAFSFTVKASKELRDRVKEIVGEEKGYLVNVSTFHSFCREVLKEDIGGLHRTDAPNSQDLDEDGQEKGDRRRIAQAINDLQYESVNVDDVYNFIIKCKLGDLPSKAENSEYAKIYERYEQRLKEDCWIDYPNQLLFTDELFRDVPTVKKKWQDKFELIFVDEYQDTDPVQYRIIKALGEKHQNLRVVGDDDQGIYGWRGADIQNILNFENDYRTSKEIKLEQNYRSTQRIVELSCALAEFNPDRRHKDLFTRNLEGEKVKHLHGENANVEAETIADFISRAIKKGRDPNDFAVLYRRNKQVEPFKIAFKKFGILFHEVKKSSDQDTHGVSLMTIHKSKGLEFPNVFVAGVCKNLLPNYYSRHEKDWGEELRLLYVAMTRAKNWLCLSSYDYDDEHTRGRSPFFERGCISANLLESVGTLKKMAIPPIPKKIIAQNAVEQSDAPVEPLPISPQTVIGIDPGNIGANTTNVGWSVTQKSADGYSVLCFGNENPKGTPENRLEEIKQKIDKLIKKYSPTGIAVERIEIGIEATIEDWFLYVAGCVTAIRSIAAQHKIECHLYTPKQVKYIATSNRNALKKDVQYGVKRVCDLSEIPKPDHSADAIAASLCYLRSYLNSSRFDGNKQKKERWNKGCAYLDESQYDAAVSEFRETINIDPIYPDAHYGLGRAYLGQANLIEAENSAKETLRLDKNYQQAHNLLEDIRRSYYNQGCDHLDNQQYNEAIAAFNEVIGRDSNFIEAYCGIGRAYFMQGNLKDAENYVERALRLDENYQPALQIRESIKQKYCELARNYFNQDDLTAAENYANKALRLDPNYPPALQLLDDIKKAYVQGARDAINLNNLDEAEKFAKEAYSLDEDYQPAYKLLESIKHYRQGCNAMSNKQFDTAIDKFQEAINLEPIFTEAYCKLSRAYLAAGDLETAKDKAQGSLRHRNDYSSARNLLEVINFYDTGIDLLNDQLYGEAIDTFKRVVHREPIFTEAHYSLGCAYFHSDALESAEQSAKDTLELNSNHQLARALLDDIQKKYNTQGLDFIAYGMYANAIKPLEKVCELNPNDQEVWANLGRAYYLIDDYFNAARCYGKVTDLDPTDENAYSNLGNAYFRMGAYATSIEPLQKACELNPNCEEFHYYLGRAQFKLDRLGEAKLAAEKALEIDQGHHRATELLKKIEKRSHEIIRMGNPDMILIPAGEFQMGCGDRDAPSNEKPIHTVYLDDFYMDKYPVTNAQYKRFIDANPQWRKDRIPRRYHNGSYLKHWRKNNYPNGKANHPIVHISWYAAMAYTEWAGKRLPTEAEWEKAARGGLVSQIYPWGALIDSSKANYDRNVKRTTSVGDYPANNYGLYDMAGNVWEWCLDEYNEDFYVKSPCHNPVAGGTLRHTIDLFRNVKSSRVLRGGSWSVEPQDVRSTARTWKSPNNTCPDLGFRCVRSVIP